ncbi:MAG: 2'-5' RNA ligase family protein [Sphingomonas sp.]
MIKPPPEVVEEIDFVRRQLGLYRGYPKDRLHITVQPLGFRRNLSNDAIEEARAAADALVHPFFHVAFEQVNGGKLEGSEPISGFLAFRAALQKAMSARLSYRKHRSTPHITLVYRRLSGFCRIDAISWRVEEFLLIESVQGEGRHIERGRWQLHS